MQALPAGLKRLARTGPAFRPAPAVSSRPQLASPPELTAEQIRRYLGAIDPYRPDSVAYLLHGVTGSGKTEVYLRLIERMLAAGRSRCCCWCRKSI